MRQLGTIRLDMPDGTQSKWEIQRDDEGRWIISCTRLGLSGEGKNFAEAYEAVQASVKQTAQQTQD
jgi:hypothetical protein